MSAQNFKYTGKFVILSENKILAHMRGLGDKKFSKILHSFVLEIKLFVTPI